MGTESTNYIITILWPFGHFGPFLAPSHCLCLYKNRGHILFSLILFSHHPLLSHLFSHSLLFSLIFISQGWGDPPEWLLQHDVFDVFQKLRLRRPPLRAMRARPLLRLRLVSFSSSSFSFFIVVWLNFFFFWCLRSNEGEE